jgi:hypothetical protein
VTTLYEDLEQACAQRDSARDIAMTLEQENAEIRSRLSTLRIAVMLDDLTCDEIVERIRAVENLA